MSARWRTTLEALELARSEYRTLLAATPDVRALRRLRRRLHDLEALSAALACELRVGA